MEKMRTIIVEDDIRVRNTIKDMLDLFCENDIELVGEAENVTEAILEIRSKKPNLVLMDIHLDANAIKETPQIYLAPDKLLPGTISFEIFEAFDPPFDFQLVFITGYHEFAVRAFELAAIGYVVKPIAPAMLIKYVTRAKENWLRDKRNLASSPFLENMRIVNLQEKLIAIPLIKNIIEYVKIGEIIYVAADGDCSTVYLTDKRKLTSTRGIGKFEKRLTDTSQKGGFIRPHNSYLVNPKHIKRYYKGELFLEVSNGDRISVSKAKRNLELDEFL